MPLSSSPLFLACEWKSKNPRRSIKVRLAPRQEPPARNDPMSASALESARGEHAKVRFDFRSALAATSAARRLVCCTQLESACVAERRRTRRQEKHKPVDKPATRAFRAFQNMARARELVFGKLYQHRIPGSTCANSGSEPILPEQQAFLKTFRAWPALRSSAEKRIIPLRGVAPRPVI